MRKDLNIELMRLVFIFMICMVHAIGYVPDRWEHWLANISFVGVIGFVLISGYFGITFKFAKALKVEGVGIGCAITVIITAWLCGVNFSFQTALLEVVRLFKGYWFIHAYVVMMALSALIAPKTPLSIKAYFPFFALVYGWSFLILIPGVQHVIPRSPGLEPYSGLSLFAAYLAGRLYRQCDFDNRFSMDMVLAVLAVSLLFVATIWPFTRFGGAFARYNSPFLIVAGLCLFWLLRKIRVADLCGKLIALITPSVLSIYLLHCNEYGYKVFDLMERQMCGLWPCLTWMILAMVAFMGGIVLDIPRRIVLKLFMLLFSRLKKDR